MSKKEGHQKSLELAKERLKTVNVRGRFNNLGFDVASGKDLEFRLFGKKAVYSPETHELINVEPTMTPRMDDAILFYHYLLCEVPIKPSEEYFNFRELLGGQFYWNPYQSRTVKPLVKRIGNDIDLLKKQLDRFDWEEKQMGDFAAKIEAFGNLHILLVYHLGDDEFPPAADILFPKPIKHVFSAEDAAVLASRICLGLL